MMSLTEPSPLSIIKVQYLFKLKSYTSMFINLIAVQVLGILLSFGGVSSIQSSTYKVDHITGDLIIILTFIWLVTLGILTARESFDLDFSFVTTRLTSNLSNILFLITSSIMAGVSATLCGLFLRTIMFINNTNVLVTSFEPYQLLISVAAVSLYAVLISSFGYFLGMVIRKKRILIVLLPIIAVVLLFFEPGTFYQNISHQGIITSSITFFTQENSFTIFVAKSLSVSILFYLGVITFSSRMEVK